MGGELASSPEPSHDERLRELKARLQEVDDLESASRLLYWDQSTYMPPGGAPARARQDATLQRLAHEKLTHPEVGRLLDELRPLEASLPPDSDDASLIRVTRRDYERAVKVPPDFTARLASHQAASYQAWTTARPADDFAAVRPHLERALDLPREYSGYFPGRQHVADPLIDLADEGLTAASVSALFAELRRQLVPLVQAITSQPLADDSCLRQPFPEPAQWDFGVEVVRQLGYDFQRGRLDRTHHPFMTKFSLGDVRITTRVKPDDLREALFGTIHEAGHALYEQGIRPALEGTPLAGGTSAGVHESQSRLWENVVGRSRGFWRHFYPRLQARFPTQLADIPLERFYRAVNKVERSLIRVDADEVTYNLHVMIRFDLELALLEGRLAVADLPDAWRQRYRDDLGVTPPDDRDGVLQDVHWFSHHVGGVFQGYTLGNVLSAQLFEAAVRDHPAIPGEIEAGEFATLRGWLTERVYQHGRKHTAPELVARATGQPLSIAPYVRHLRTKYGELYRL